MSWYTSNYKCRYPSSKVCHKSNTGALTSVQGNRAGHHVNVSKKNDNYTEITQIQNGFETRSEQIMNNFSFDSDHDIFDNNHRDETRDDLDDKYLPKSYKDYTSDSNLGGYQTQVPFPIHILISVKEGDSMLKVISQRDIKGLAFGDVIHIAHPYFSYNYTIQSIDGCFVYLDRAFDYSPVLKKKLDDRNDILNRLTNPYGIITSRMANIGNNQIVPLEESCIFTTDSCAMVDNLTKTNIDDRKPLSLIQARIWKVIQNAEDNRLMWRRLYDDGLVKWCNDFDVNSGFVNYLSINVKLCELEKLCFDSHLDPDQSIHQQRVHYFERVPLHDILNETYKTVCEWHPKSSTIDIVKWAKLARSMKFLSSIRNSNHEVDMAFFRQSNNRKLNYDEFTSVLIDIASRKYPSPHYNEVESLSRLLWTSVVNIPQVNKMVWATAKHFAMEEELKRMSSQIRISAFYRMRKCNMIFRSKREAAVIVSKWIRMCLAVKRANMSFAVASLDWVYRVRYRSAIICQKNWRMYPLRKSLQIYKMSKRLSFEKLICSRWRRMVWSCLRRWILVMYMESVNIQSFPASVTMITSTSALDDEDKILTIRVLLHSSNIWFVFNLSRLEIKKCLENIAVQRGPLSQEELLTQENIRTLTCRLSIDSTCVTPSVAFLMSGVIEEGDLVVNELSVIQGKTYVLSAFRSHEHIVLHFYDQELQEKTRIVFLFCEVSNWLDECYDIRNNKPINALKVWNLSQLRQQINANMENLRLIKTDPAYQPQLYKMHNLLSVGNDLTLVRWLASKIKITRMSSCREITLEYEQLSDQIVIAVIKCQSWWRSILAQKVAQNEVHLQYEKHFDRTANAFAYIHTRTGALKWAKPILLKNNDDIVNPPDEWRVAETATETGMRIFYFNPLTGQSSWLSEAEAASMVQKAFRRRQDKLLLTSHLTFKQVVNAIVFIRDVETKYTANPNKLSHIVNFALLNHFVHFDLSQAKSLYQVAISKSFHHPVTARAYGIFILLRCEPPFVQTFEKASQLFREASAIDPKAEKFKAAKENFILLSMMLSLNEPLALLNYALLHQCVLGEYYLAEKIYRRALAQNPDHQATIENYNMFIDQRYPGGTYEGQGVPHIICKRSIILEERDEWGEFKLMKDPLSQRFDFSTFWINIVDKTTSFEEPNWKTAWLDRVKRSQITCALKLWIEYYDYELKRSFIYNKSTGEYVWKS